MRKGIIIGVSVVASVLLAALIAGYFYGRAHIKDVPPILQESLKKQEIQFKYASAHVPATGLAIDISDISVTGPKLPYFVKAKKASIRLGFALRFPPFKVVFSADHPELQANPSLKSEQASSSKPATATDTSSLKYVGLALRLFQFDVSVLEADLPDFGVHRLTASSTLRSLELTQKGVEKAVVGYDISAGEITKAPWAAGIHLTGHSVYRANAIETENNRLALGPFNIQLSAKYDLNSQKWNADLYIPETDVKKASSLINQKAVAWLNSIAGIVSLRVIAEGAGSDIRTTRAQGKIQAKNLRLNVNHENLRGDIETNVNTEFIVEQGETVKDLKLAASADLTKAEVVQTDMFLKPKGVPASFNIVGGGRDGRVTIQKGEGTFHNLNLQLEGELQAGKEPTGNLKINIARTSLSGWEKFFPKYSRVKSQGTLEGSAAYAGPLKEWREAQVEAKLRADNVRLPILKQWIPSKDITIEGITSLSSDTTIAYSRGVLKTLATQTAIDLKQNSIEYKDVFRKPSGVALSADLVVASTGTRAEITKGDLRLGQAKARVKGSIQNFANPSADINFNTDLIPLTELLAYSPTAKIKSVSNLGCSLSIKGNVTGPLTNKKVLPQVRGEMTLKQVTLDYELESRKKIKVTNISGPMQFTDKSVAMKKILIGFPKTEGTLDAQVVSFDSPDINFAFQGNRFALSDFYDTQGKSSPGLVAVPVSTKPKGTEEDFRKNPYLKKIKILGSAFLKQADLGWTKAESVTAKISYDNLLLRIDPLSMKTFGGSFSSTTEWNGRPQVPTTKVTLKVDAVDSNQFVSHFSEKMKDIIFGKLNSQMSLQFSGLTPDEMLKTTEGKGAFALTDGELKTFRFSQKPLESLQKIPLIASNIKKTAWEEKFNQITGSFSVKEGKIWFSDLITRSQYFDLVAKEVNFDFNQNIQAKVTWLPKENIIPASSLELLKDEQGKPSIPLTVSGPIRSPNISVDQQAVEQRVKAFAMRKLEEEKQRATAEIKSKVQQEIKKQLKGGLGDIFK